MLSSTGCQNRGWCGNSCYPCGPFRRLGGATTIAPPATYSVQIPNAPAAQPYYNRDAATAQQNLPTPSRSVPPANPTPGQPGWRPVGTNETTQLQGQPTQSVVERNNQFQNVARGNDLATLGSPSGMRSADLRNDPTRLPVSDATSVRAPAGMAESRQFVQTGFSGPIQAVVPPTYVGTPSFQDPFNQSFVPAAYDYRGQPIFGQPVFAQALTQTYPGFATNPAVLAQSTVYADSANRADQGGWRDGELTASRGSLNR